MGIVDINRNPSPRQLRWFGCMFLPAFLLLVGWRADPHVELPALGLTAGLAGLSVLVASVAPRAMRPVFVGLSLVTFPIGWVVTHLLVVLVFYALLAPLGLVLRLSGHDALGLRFQPVASYWVRRGPPHGLARYFRQS